MWTDSKVALKELIYTLHFEGVYNNGAVDLKDIAEYFEHVFDIDLGQYRCAFIEIRARKRNTHSLNETLKMDGYFCNSWSLWKLMVCLKLIYEDDK